MASSCSDARHKLLECLADSPCFLGGRTVKECVQLSAVDSGCKELNTALFNCRRGQVRKAQGPCRRRCSFACVSVNRPQLDMRKRIKGNSYFQGEGADEAQSAAPPAGNPR
jgi:hypothetical protein